MKRNSIKVNKTRQQDMFDENKHLNSNVYLDYQVMGR